MNKPTWSQNLTFDCDDVLSESTQAILHHNNHEFAGKPLIFDKIDKHYRHEIEGFEHTTLEQAIEIFHNFLKDTELHKTIKPIDHALERLLSLKEEGHELYVVTARDSHLANNTADRLSEHFPGIFKDIYHINYETKPYMLKSQICKQIGSTIMVDDAPANAQDLSAHGIHTFLFSQPWNTKRWEENSHYPNIQPVDSWKEIV